MPVRSKLTRPLSVRHEFINSRGLSVRGRNRIREVFRPTRLMVPRRVITDIMAEPNPTSASVYNRATMIQKKKPRKEVAAVLSIR